MKLIARTTLAKATTSLNSSRERSTPGMVAVALAVTTVLFCLSLQGRAPSFDSATLAASKSLEAKMQILDSKDTRPSPSHPAVVITEFEANSYLKVHSGEFLPPGVRTPALSVQPELLTGNADVDFDQLSRSYPNPNDMGPKILAAMFHGVQRVTVTARIESQNNGVMVHIEKVVVGNMTVPNWLVDYVIQNVLQPRYEFDLSKPVPYPDHVTMIVLGSGQVTFLRGAVAGGSRQ